MEWFFLCGVTAAIKQGNYPSIPADKETDVPDGARTIIQHCFKESKERPTFTDLLPLLQGLVGDLEIWLLQIHVITCTRLGKLL